jgi:hypothetical protein
MRSNSSSSIQQYLERLHASLNSSSSNGRFGSTAPDATSEPAADDMKSKLQQLAAAVLADKQLSQQLFSLLISCLKRVQLTQQGNWGNSSYCQQCFVQAACICSSVIMLLPDTCFTSSGGGSSSSSSGGSSSRQQHSHWLVLVCRCLSVMCQQLAAEEPDAAAVLAAALAGAAKGNRPAQPAAVAAAAAAAAAGSAAQFIVPDARSVSSNASKQPGSRSHPALCRAEWMLPVLASSTAWVGELLTAESHLPAQQQPAAAGHCPGLRKLLKQHAVLQPQLDAAAAAAVGTAKGKAAGRPQSALQESAQLLGQQLLQQLQAFAEAVAAAHCLRYCCNNSGCLNVSGLSEAELVGKSRCSGCKACFYSSRECQAAAWPLRKRVCKQLQAAHQHNDRC